MPLLDGGGLLGSSRCPVVWYFALFSVLTWPCKANDFLHHCLTSHTRRGISPFLYRYKMMLSCWRETTSDRPSFAELVQRLDELLSAMLPDEVRQLFCLAMLIELRVTVYRYVWGVVWVGSDGLVSPTLCLDLVLTFCFSVSGYVWYVSPKWIFMM